MIYFKNLSLCLLIQFNKPKEPQGFYIHKMFFARVSPLLGTGWEWCWGRMETAGAFSSGPLMEAQSNEMLLIHSPAIQGELVGVRGEWHWENGCLRQWQPLDWTAASASSLSRLQKKHVLLQSSTAQHRDCFFLHCTARCLEGEDWTSFWWNLSISS